MASSRTVLERRVTGKSAASRRRLLAPGRLVAGRARDLEPRPFARVDVREGAGS